MEKVSTKWKDETGITVELDHVAKKARIFTTAGAGAFQFNKSKSPKIRLVANALLRIADHMDREMPQETVTPQ